MSPLSKQCECGMSIFGDADTCPICRDNMKCIPGCRIYDHGEIYHHKDCPHYPESFSKRYDNLKAAVTWAVNHYTIVDTDGIFKHLLKVLESPDHIRRVTPDEIRNGIF